MNKEEFIQRAAISALPELIRIEEAQQVAAATFSDAVKNRQEMQRRAAARAICYASTLWHALGYEGNEEKEAWQPTEEKEKTLITGETRNEAINRYRAMMKANEGKSFEERRDAINNFRAGR